MRLLDLIDADRIVLGLRVRDKSEALSELAKRAARHLSLDASVVLAALIARERLGSTGFGHGFALPHVRLDGLAAPAGLLARLARPIEYEAVDGKPVDVLFLLAIPVGKAGDNVTALAAVSRAMRDERTLAAVRRADDPAALLDALTAAETETARTSKSRGGDPI